jgi:SAM-dependent methyltransferase
MQNKNPEAPWYSEQAGLFGPAYLKEYGPMLTDERTKLEADFLGAVLYDTLYPSTRILDLACGHGRHAIELARRGYRVTGVDLNAFFLEVAGRAAREAKVHEDFVQGDMRRVPLNGEFDVVLNLFTAFGYFDTNEENTRVVREIARLLKQGGVFVLDVMNKERLMRVFKEKDWGRLSDGSIILREHTFDLISGRNYERRVRHRASGEVEEVHISLRLYTLAELITMCKKAGLKLQEVYGDFDGNPLVLDSPRCILVTRKT